MSVGTQALSPLERLEANESIRDLLSAYCVAVDAGDFDAMAELFVDDDVHGEGFVDGGVVGHHRGRAAIAAAFRALQGSGDPPRWSHLVGNVVIRHLTPGRAQVRSAFVGTQQEAGGDAVVGAVGRYVDEVVLAAGDWQFASRLIILDLRSI